MIENPIKRLEYILRQDKKPLIDDDGQPTQTWRNIFYTTLVVLFAVGQDDLAKKMIDADLDFKRGKSSRLIDVIGTLREFGIERTPYDNLVPWTYREVSRLSAGGDDGMVDWLIESGAAIMQWQNATRTDIMKMSAYDVLRAIAHWESDAKPAKNVGEIVYRFRDGWTVQNLKVDASLKEEGKLLKHCVGGYCEQVAAGWSVIYSLRDRKNVPRITMEFDPERRKFEQIYGEKNSRPTPDVQPYLVEFINEVFDGDPAGLLMAGVPANQINLSNAHLALADLRNADLIGADLHGAKLGAANLSFANLRGANLFRAEMYNATLIRADLSEADLSESDLTNARSSDANFSGADLSGANLSFAILRGAKLNGAILRGAKLLGADLYGADLRGADLTDANLRNAHLLDADLEGADLEGADLTGATR